MIARNVPKIDAPDTRTGTSITSAPKYAIFRQFQAASWRITRPNHAECVGLVDEVAPVDQPSWYAMPITSQLRGSRQAFHRDPVDVDPAEDDLVPVDARRAARSDRAARSPAGDDLVALATCSSIVCVRCGRAE